MTVEDCKHQRTYKELIEEYKGEIVHGTRSLDRSYYHSLESTITRDKNQVVTRALLKELSEKGVEVKAWWPIITVGQLWLWVIDESR